MGPGGRQGVAAAELRAPSHVRSASFDLQRVAQLPHLAAPRMVVGFSAGARSGRALDYAVGDAARLGGSVICIHVDCPPDWMDWAAICDLGPHIVRPAVLEQTPTVEAEVSAAQQRAGVPIELVVVAARHPVEGIAAVVRSVAADHVVIGASSPRRFRLRSTVGGSLQRATNCPVTVVP